MTTHQIGANLGAALVEEDRTQAWLADRLGVQRANVGRWIRGEKPVPEAHREKILALLHRPKRAIFGR